MDSLATHKNKLALTEDSLTLITYKQEDLFKIVPVDEQPFTASELSVSAHQFHITEPYSTLMSLAQPQ